MRLLCQSCGLLHSSAYALLTCCRCVHVRLCAVQGGSWQNRLPNVLDSSVRANRVHVRSNPRNW